MQILNRQSVFVKAYGSLGLDFRDNESKDREFLNNLWDSSVNVTLEKVDQDFTVKQEKVANLLQAKSHILDENDPLYGTLLIPNDLLIPKKIIGINHDWRGIYDNVARFDWAITSFKLVQGRLKPLLADIKPNWSDLIASINQWNLNNPTSVPICEIYLEYLSNDISQASVSASLEEAIMYKILESLYPYKFGGDQSKISTHRALFNQSVEVLRKVYSVRTDNIDDESVSINHDNPNFCGERGRFR